MANEKNENVTPMAKSILTKKVEMRRVWNDFTNEQGENVQCEGLEVCCTFAGESIRFKVDPKNSKLIRVLMRMHGYPLYAKDGSVIPEEYVADEDL